MSAARPMHRHVRHLRLACIQEDHARHGRILLEDALRTASFGDEGRLVVIRALHVGRIPLRASATHWSQRIEQSYRRLQPIPISADSPGAEHAAAVYFANAYEPWLRVAERAAAGQPCPEWYWGAALPEWTSRLNAGETLRLAFRALAAQGGLRLTLLLARRLRSLAPLLQALRVGDLGGVRGELIAGGKGDVEAVAEGDDDARKAAVRFARAVDPVKAATAASWPAGDLRVRWLAAAYLARNASTGLSTSLSLDVAPAAIDALVRLWNERSFTQTPAHLAEPPTEPVVNATPSPTPEPPDQAEPASQPAVADRTLTRAGGLFFVVPLLTRVGLPEFIAKLPNAQRAAYPWHVLHLILRHALTARGRMGSSPQGHAEANRTARRHVDFEREDLVASDPVVAALVDLPEPPPALGHWLIRANSHALRLTGLNLRQLVLRPALVSWSPTHTELFFRSGDADVRIRRAGLDVDPGWVPWLNRVIHYHYNREM